MPLQIKKQNILDSGCDIIVNPTDAKYSGSGGIDAQIHKAAGIELLSACKNLKELDTGAVQYTALFDHDQVILGCY